MTIQTGNTNSWKTEIMQGIHAPTDTYKLLLIKTGHTGVYGPATTNMGTPGSGAPSNSNLGTDEVSGPGYTSGGITLAAPSYTLNGSRARMDFADPTALTNCTFSADGAMIVNTSKGGRVLGVYLFASAPVAANGGSFTVDMPAAGDTTSLMRLE